MSRIFKLLGWLLVLSLVAIVVFAGYVAAAFGLIPGLRPPVSTQTPAAAVDPAQAKLLETKLSGALGTPGPFAVELTEAELNTLLHVPLGAESRLREAGVRLGRGRLDFSATVEGSVSLPVRGSVMVGLEAGRPRLTVVEIGIAAFTLPGAAAQLASPVVDQIVDLDRAVAAEGNLRFDKLEVTPEKVSMAGVNNGGSRIVLRGAGAITPPGKQPSRSLPSGRAESASGNEQYLALGDSLAANVGASGPLAGYAARVHRYLETVQRRTFGYTNVGVSGETTGSLTTSGQLQQALDLINRLKNDGNPATKVSYITLDIGANDINVVLKQPSCKSDPQGGACKGGIANALNAFRSKLESIVMRLNEAREPGSVLVVLTYFNPYNLGTGLPFETESEEAVRQLNEHIRAVATASNVPLADVYPYFGSDAGILTHILEGDIHPVDQGYERMAVAVADALDAGR